MCVCVCVCVYTRAHAHVCVFRRSPLPQPRPTLSCPVHTRRSSAPSVAPFQTILVGDSGVGKTSLLVQFDQGKFVPGSFSATVGIGFTVSTPGLGGPAGPLTGSWQETGGRSHWVIQKV